MGALAGQMHQRTHGCSDSCLGLLWGFTLLIWHALQHQPYLAWISTGSMFSMTAAMLIFRQDQSEQPVRFEVGVALIPRL